MWFSQVPRERFSLITGFFFSQLFLLLLLLLLVGPKIYNRHLLHKLITNYHTVKETNNEYCLQTPICTVSVCILSRKLFTSSQTAVDKTAVIIIVAHLGQGHLE